MILLTLLGLLALQTASDVAGQKQMTTAGGYCSLPFTYNGVMYRSCTTKNHNRPWCSTTPNYNEEKKWGDCTGFKASGVGTTSRQACAFPFVYQGISYNSCTSKNRNRPWCSTTVNYDKDRMSGNCAGYTSSGLKTKSGQYCVFPFRYEGKSYKSCTTKNEKKPWCATTADFDKDYKYGMCAGYNGGRKTKSGEYCALPFVYRGHSYNTCIRKNYHSDWCSTTTNYDKDGKWGTCA